MDLNFTINIKQNRFETEIDGEFAFIDYRFYKGDIVLMHTFVPEFARGQGISSALAHFALEYIKDQGLKMIVYCPYISKYLKDHPEYQVLLKEQE